MDITERTNITLTIEQQQSETRAAIATVTQETIERGGRHLDYPRVMPAHGLPSCPQCDRPVTHGRADGHCSARCLIVATTLDFAL